MHCRFSAHLISGTTCTTLWEALQQINTGHTAVTNLHNMLMACVGNRVIITPPPPPSGSLRHENLRGASKCLDRMRALVLPVSVSCVIEIGGFRYLHNNSLDPGMGCRCIFTSNKQTPKLINYLFLTRVAFVSIVCVEMNTEGRTTSMITIPATSRPVPPRDRY